MRLIRLFLCISSKVAFLITVIFKAIHIYRLISNIQPLTPSKNDLILQNWYSSQPVVTFPPGPFNYSTPLIISPFILLLKKVPSPLCLAQIKIRCRALR
ncbi:hypothetical protein CEXT_215621 [Caerostris extrusa]|uniref:Secreted protein n=1 Tax=Caerostris extrusa TaxID=172846 RepID=A0AAV4TT51_CAEEX|nr:hypothetical protein CEXT_215621 [Caerostris extrusa]